SRRAAGKLKHKIGFTTKDTKKNARREAPKTVLRVLRGSSVSFVASSEAQRLRPDHVGNGADLVDDGVGERLVYLDEGDGVLAGRGAAEMEGRDIDAVLAQGAAEITDEARLVLVADEQHRGAELGLHGDTLDLDETRLVAAEERAGDDVVIG